MLELKNITKVYEIGNKKKGTYLKVDALKGISIKFRKQEFVSILGQSGCGKTTLLNIIGGLDKYTKGDLIINDKSTKKFQDKDWDTYRNHSIGFVFQSYNLIPHQTVLENVTLALTLSGISKKERERRAKAVLKRVGLKDKIYSKPNQLSGGQMQRVAIARALVNDPDIILADEPTGALDSKTSVQVMELLKEISKEKLIVMVTHNPELANTYSTRIIQLSDGELVGDSNPFTKEESVEDDRLISMTSDEELSKREINKKNKKKSMSFFTALSLSLKNLFTKKARTLLVSIAGSIGIIGIALILSLSNGFQAYINNVQQDTLSSYPITINSATVDYTAMLEMVMSGGENDSTPKADDKIYSEDVIISMFKNILQGAKTNDLKSFKEFLDSNEEIKEYTTGIQYTYNLGMSIYGQHTETVDGTERLITTQLNPNNMFYEGVMAYFGQYAEKVIVDNACVTMYVKNQLGITSDPMTAEEQNLVNAEIAKLSQEQKNTIIANTSDTIKSAIATQITEAQKEVVVQSIISKLSTSSTTGTTGGDLSTLQNSDMGLWTEMIDNNKLLKAQYDVVAIESGSDKKTLFSNLAYNEVVLAVDANGNLSDYILYALGIKTTPTIDEIATGMFNDIGFQMESSYYEHIDILGKTYPVLLDSDYYLKLDANGNIDEENGTLVDIRTVLKSSTNPTGLLDQEQYDAIIEDLLENSEIKLKIKAIVKPKEGVSATSISGSIGYSKLLIEKAVEKLNADIVAKGIDDKLQAVDLTNPSSISLYCADFESKAEIEKIITEYNEGKAEEDQISYTDFVGVMMSSISTIINAISYVLIAFVSISLIVSSIMIGIITYISVLERTKEIGVLRSIGASKRDIKRVFTAESLIIGTLSGVLGILITLLLNVPINIIINSLAGLSGVASLPVAGAFILIGISMLLTFIAGLIPAQFASKKDPVVALRTE